MLSVGCLIKTARALSEGIMDKSKNPFGPTETLVYANESLGYIIDFGNLFSTDIDQNRPDQTKQIPDQTETRPNRETR